MRVSQSLKGKRNYWAFIFNGQSGGHSGTKGDTLLYYAVKHVDISVAVAGGISIYEILRDYLPENRNGEVSNNRNFRPEKNGVGWGKRCVFK